VTSDQDRAFREELWHFGVAPFLRACFFASVYGIIFAIGRLAGPEFLAWPVLPLLVVLGVFVVAFCLEYQLRRIKLLHDEVQILYAMLRSQITESGVQVVSDDDKTYEIVIDD